MDTPWAATHRSRLRLTLTLIIVISLIIYFSISLYEPPSCADNKQNQGEVGRDCGGPCELYCASQVQAAREAWVQSFEVSEGWWSALAYIENPNFDKQVRYAPYRFVLYDSAGEVILERQGSTFINREPIVPIFQGRLNVADRVPHRTVFEWLQELEWHVAPEYQRIEIEEQVLRSNGVGKDLEVILYNKSPDALSNIEVVAILYDKTENVVAFSETYLDRMVGRSKQKVLFSWPRPFTGEVGRIEIIPRVPEQAR